MTSLTFTTTEQRLVLQPQDAPQLVLTAPATTQLVLQTAGVQGPPGLSSDTMTLTAQGAISALRVVSLSGSQGALTNPASVASLAAVVGIATIAAADGATVQVRGVGQVADPAWSWTPGLPLFCAAAGVLTQVPPATIATRQIGVAISATTILIDLSDIILLE